MIDGVLGPLGLANHWDILPLGGLPEPSLCLAAGFQIEGNFRRSVRCLAGGPWGTGRHPALEILADLLGELRAFGGHRRFGIGVVHGPDQQAGFRLSGNNGRTAVPARDETRARVEAETALKFLSRGAVALVAMLHQHRPDPLLEKFKTD